MDSIGKRFQEARSSLGQSLDYVARETNISRGYLENLENDNYEGFPGEPYLMGFLRNYSEYLGLDPKEILGQYRNYKLQEQPVPMDELIIRRSSFPVKGFLIVLAVAALGALLWWSLPLLGNWLSSLSVPRPAGDSREAVVYTLGPDQISLNNRVFQGDSLELFQEEGSQEFLVNIHRNELLLVQPGIETTALRLGEEIFVDIDQDNMVDFRFLLVDINPNAPEVGASISVERIMTPQTMSEGVLTPVAVAGTTTGAPASQMSMDLRPAEARTFLSRANRQPYQLEIVFRGSSLVRYVADGGERVQAYYNRGDSLEIPVQGELALWVSNAGAFAGTLAGEDFELGRQGQVFTGLVRWTPDGAGYLLQLVPFY